MKLKYITALNTFYELQWNLQLKRWYNFSSNSTNTVIPLHVSQGFITGLHGPWKRERKPKKMKGNYFSSSEPRSSSFSSTAVWSKPHKGSCQNNWEGCSTGVKWESTETHKLFSWKPSSLLQVSIWDLGSIILAVGFTKAGRDRTSCGSVVY